jgi:hypothetical protein
MNIHYYDITLKMPYLDEIQETRLKISASSLNHLFHDLLKYYNVDINMIISISKYERSVTRGHTRIDFLLIQRFSSSDVKSALRAFRNSVLYSAVK